MVRPRYTDLATLRYPCAFHENETMLSSKLKNSMPFRILHVVDFDCLENITDISNTKLNDSGLLTAPR